MGAAAGSRPLPPRHRGRPGLQRFARAPLPPVDFRRMSFAPCPPFAETMPVKVVFSKISTDLSSAPTPLRLCLGRILENLHLDRPPFRPPPRSHPGPSATDHMEQSPGVFRFAVFRLGALLLQEGSINNAPSRKNRGEGCDESTLAGATYGQFGDA